MGIQVRVADVPVSSYMRLLRRVQREIMRPRSQLERRVVIVRQADEREADWDLLLEQLGDEEHVRVVQVRDGAVEVAWRNYPAV